MKKTLKYSLCFLLLLLIVPAGLNYSGFCWKQDRWLTRDDFMLAGVKAWSEEKEGLEDTSEQSLRAYLKNNPHCCELHIGSDGLDPNFAFLNRITSFVYADFHTQYKINKRTFDTLHSKMPEFKDTYHELYFNMDACGKAGIHYGEHNMKINPVFEKSETE